MIKLEIVIHVKSENAKEVLQKIARQKHKGVKVHFQHDRFYFKFHKILDKLYNIKPDYLAKNYAELISQDLEKLGVQSYEYEVVVR